MEVMDNMEMRMQNIHSIRRTLVDTFGNTIYAAIVYGSVLNSDFCETSDYDILLVFKTMNMDTLKTLHNIKKYFESIGIIIDFNSHLISDLPNERGKLYWHNNRSVFIQQELASTGYSIIGGNPFAGYKAEIKDMQIEAVRMLNSFAYQSRKLIINKDLNNTENRMILVKWCIYGSLYLLAGKGLFYNSRKEGLSQFTNVIKTNTDPMCFLYIKINRPKMITDEDIELAYDYINYLDIYAINMFKQVVSYGVDWAC